MIKYYLKVLIGILIVSNTLSLGSPDKNSQSWTLRFENHHSSEMSTDQWTIIHKGPYSIRINIGSNWSELKDDSSCATLKLAYLIKEELEYGQESIWKLHHLDHRNRELWSKKLRRIELTYDEFIQIIKFCIEQRGFHNCVYDNSVI